MTIHISARLTWHADGWNGHVCEDPASNTYCVGPYSYPGEMIAEKRDLQAESRPENRGLPISKAKLIPPCIYSAKGEKGIGSHFRLFDQRCRRARPATLRVPQGPEQSRGTSSVERAQAWVPACRQAGPPACARRHGSSERTGLKNWRRPISRIGSGYATV